MFSLMQTNLLTYLYGSNFKTHARLESLSLPCPGSHSLPEVLVLPDGLKFFLHIFLYISTDLCIVTCLVFVAIVDRKIESDP